MKAEVVPETLSDNSVAHNVHLTTDDGRLVKLACTGDAEAFELAVLLNECAHSEVVNFHGGVHS